MGASQGGDFTNKYQWLTEEGRLKIRGVANETIGVFNISTIYYPLIQMAMESKAAFCKQKNFE